MKFNTFLSLKSLILIGFSVAVIPLLLAVLWTALDVRETSLLGKSINSQVFEQTKQIRKVLQKTSEIERKANLFVLLAADSGDGQSYERTSYETVRASFKQALNDFLQLNSDNEIALLVNELAEKENLIYEQIIAVQHGDSSAPPFEAAFQDLHESSLKLSRQFEDHVEHQIKALADKTAAIEHGLMLKGTALLLISATVIGLLLTTISPSLRQLDTAIRRLGSGDLASEIAVQGPSDLQYLGNRLEWLRVRLLDLEASKQQFIQNVIREIEGPLDNIRQHSAQLTRELADAGDEQAPTDAEVLAANVLKLQNVTEEILRYSQISANVADEEKRMIDMMELVEAAIAEWQPQLSEKNLTLRKLLRPLPLTGNREQLQSIVRELLSNAIRYSPTDGEIRLLLRECNELMELEVEDEGEGIADDERSHVFEPFFRGRHHQTDAVSGGAGLGLTVVKEYVANHQGQIEIMEPRQDHAGARLRVKIPLTKSS